MVSILPGVGKVVGAGGKSCPLLDCAQYDYHAAAGNQNPEVVGLGSRWKGDAYGHSQVVAAGMDTEARQQTKEAAPAMSCSNQNSHRTPGFLGWDEYGALGEAHQTLGTLRMLEIQCQELVGLAEYAGQGQIVLEAYCRKTSRR